MKKLEQARPFATSAQSGNTRAFYIPVEAAHLFECAAFLVSKIAIGKRTITMGKLGDATALGKALLLGREGFLGDKISACRVECTTTGCSTTPGLYVKAQKPDAFRRFTSFTLRVLLGVKFNSPAGDSVANFSSMDGRDEGKQHGCSNQGFHGDILFVNGV